MGSKDCLAFLFEMRKKLWFMSSKKYMSCSDCWSDLSLFDFGWFFKSVNENRATVYSNLKLYQYTKANTEGFSLSYFKPASWLIWKLVCNYKFCLSGQRLLSLQLVAEKSQCCHRAVAMLLQGSRNVVAGKLQCF